MTLENESNDDAEMCFGYAFQANKGQHLLVKLLENSSNQNIKAEIRCNDVELLHALFGNTSSRKLFLENLAPHYTLGIVSTGEIEKISYEK